MTPCLILLTLVLSGPAAVAEDTEALLDRGRALCDRFYAGELPGIWEEMNASMRAALGSLEGLGGFQEQVASQLGVQKEVVEEEIVDAGGARLFQRTARFSNLPQLFQVVWGFDDDGAVSGFTIQPVRTEAPSEYLDYETKTELRLPFEGEWLVFWGGRTLDVNYHTFTPDQRFAYDILIMEDGSSHTGDGSSNDDYHCFGLPVLAPGAGTIVSSARDEPDNAPGEMNPGRPLGNHVIIDHGNGEYSFLAHFQQGSLQVATGDTVEIGELLGRCGNSGNTTEPHIHYHLQDSPTFGGGKGMPSQFVDYTSNGEPVARGEPVKGEVVGNR